MTGTVMNDKFGKMLKEVVMVCINLLFQPLLGRHKASVWIATMSWGVEPPEPPGW